LVVVAMAQVEVRQVQVVLTLYFPVPHLRVAAVVAQTVMDQPDKMGVLRVVAGGIGPVGLETPHLLLRHKATTEEMQMLLMPQIVVALPVVVEQVQ
jgi:hypothetical protein